MNKGILLMCFNSTTYGKFAYNMAHSIRHYSNLPIHLLCDKESIKNIDTSIFSSFDLIDFERNDLGKIDNCKAKIKLFERSPFEKTLYLDVDGVMLNNPEELFEILKDEYFYTQPMGSGIKTDNISYTWANTSLVFERYGIKDDVIFNTCQTSIIYFTKQAKDFFNQLELNYEKRLKPIEYREMWGKSKQHPDELYYSITMAQLGVTPNAIRPVFFPEKRESDTKIQSDYYVLAMYGGTNVLPYAKALYDRIMKEKILNPKGLNHWFKIDKLYKEKFINIK
jgi:hypothetical protein